MSDAHFSIDVKMVVDEVSGALIQSRLSQKSITKKVLRTIGSKGTVAVRRRMNSVLRKRTGALRKALRSYVPRDENKNFAVIGFKKQGKGTGVYAGTKAFVNEYGATILPKKRKTLSFNAGGGFRTSDAVIIPARPFFNPAIQSYFGSGAYLDDVSEMVDKEMKKIWS